MSAPSSRRRRSGSQPTRGRSYRPFLESLEDRLPPGDILAGLATWSFLEPGLALPGSSFLGHRAQASETRIADEGQRQAPLQRLAYRPDLSDGPLPLQRGQPDAQRYDWDQLLADNDDSDSIWRGLAATLTEGEDVLASAFGRDPSPEARALLGSAPAPSGALLGGGGNGLAPASLRKVTGTDTSASGPIPHRGSAPAASTEQGLLQRAASRAPAAPAPPRAAAAVQARFDLETRSGGPFPSNWFTVADPSHNTGLRVNLPLPDPATRPSDYEDVQVLNTLDGFNLQPRLSIPFNGPIDVNSVSSNTVFLIRLGDALDPPSPQPLSPEGRGVGVRGGGQVIGINQVVWDPAANVLHVESDEVLDQHTRYALIVTNGVRDPEGRPVQASEAFRRFRHHVRGDYKQDLLEAIHAARRVGVRENEMVTASVFTTQSATAVLEKIRDQVKAATPAPADFLLGPDGTRTVFALSDVTGITFNQHRGVDPPTFNPVELNLSSLRIIPGAVGQVAFGKYLSPDYLTAERFIPPVGTRTGTPEVQGVNELYFNLFLPSGPAPAGGWPVAIWGHGFGVNKNGNPLLVAAEMAEHGIATVAISVVGLGFGPLGTLTVRHTLGDPVTFSAGGRGLDLDGDGIIGANEGLLAPRPRATLFTADATRQTIADLVQLVRVIEVGMDVDGNGSRDVDPSRVYYFGQSLGGDYGTMFLAVEPSVRAGVLNVPAGDLVEGRRLATATRPTLLGGLLAARVPSLINPPGLTSISGVPVGPPHFNENLPLRNQLPVINTVPGALEIQEVFENVQWVSQSGNPPAYAPHLRKSPLAGVPAKSLIFQQARGDQAAPNPASSVMLRAGDLADRVTFFRNDLALAEDPAVPKDPHFFMTSINSSVPLVAAIARSAQEQIATFFASNGSVIIHPEPSRFFEVPIAGPLPEDLSYIP